MTTTVYKIKNWNEVFEKFMTRDRHRGLDWVSWPTAQDSEGFLFLSRTPEGHIALGVFGALVQFAGRRRKEDRGVLADDKGPLTPERYSARYGLHIDHARAAWKLLSEPPVGWLVPQAVLRCNSDATPMQPVCNSDGGRMTEDREERTGEDISLSAGGHARELSSAEKYAARPHGLDLWEAWCARPEMPKHGKTAAIDAAGAAVIRKATELASGQNPAKFIDEAKAWLMGRLVKFRESPYCRELVAAGKCWHCKTWFNDARYNDDDGAWEQTGKSGAKAPRSNAGDGSYAGNTVAIRSLTADV